MVRSVTAALTRVSIQLGCFLFEEIHYIVFVMVNIELCDYAVN